MADDELQEMSVAQLRDIARDLDIEGRSSLTTKAELIAAIEEFRAELAERQREEMEESEEADEQRAIQQELEAVQSGQPLRFDSPVAVSREEYDRVVRENSLLRVQLQKQVQGAVGAPQSGAPNPGEQRARQLVRGAFRP